MAKAKFYQRGANLDFVNTTGSKIEANTIMVYGGRVVVVGNDIEPGEKGSIITEEVFQMPKTVETAIEAGASVYFDGEGITTASSGTLAGYAAYKAEAADKVVYVKLLG